MPFYDYRCEKGHSFEVSQRMTDDPLDSCEQCGAPAERILHSPAAAVAGASTYGSGYSAKPVQSDKSASEPGKKDEGRSWLDSVERRKGPARTFRRGLRRN